MHITNASTHWTNNAWLGSCLTNFSQALLARYAGVRKPMKYLAVVLIVGYIFFGVFPQKALPSDVDSIVIEKFVSGNKSAVGRVTLSYGEALLLSEDIGYLWCNYFVFNSWEEKPNYWLTINYTSERQEKIFVSRSEFSKGCRSSDEVIEELEKRLF